MTSRERMLAAFNFSSPDKIPVYYHPSTAGLYVHGQKLLDLFNAYPPDNPITFDKIPQPGPNTFDKDGSYHEISKDPWGTTWEYRIFGVAGHPKEYPFKSWEEAKDYQFPPLPAIGSPEFAAAKAHTDERKKSYLLIEGWFNVFEKLHALRPFDEVLVDLAMSDERLLAFLDRLVDYYVKGIEYDIARGVDIIMLGDDWGTQTGPIISPALFKEIFRPRLKRMFDRIKKAGRRIFYHSCGNIGPMFDELADLGINGFWHQVALYDTEAFAKKCKERRITVYIHPDRQRLIPLGTPKEIDCQIKAYADLYHKMGGGGILYVEMENDAPFANVEALVKAVHKYR